MQEDYLRGDMKDKKLCGDMKDKKLCGDMKDDKKEIKMRDDIILSEVVRLVEEGVSVTDRKSTRLNSSHRL